MIELFDEKLGVIKVLNVTDVRAHFASVLSDDDCNYIITKNNRPQRVMISYADFEKLKEYLQKDESVPLKDPADAEGKAAKGPIRKEPIRGMLATQIELAHKTPEKKAKRAVAREPLVKPIYQKAIVNAEPPPRSSLQSSLTPRTEDVRPRLEQQAVPPSPPVRENPVSSRVEAQASRHAGNYQPIKAKSAFVPRPEPPAIAPEKNERPRPPLPRYDAEDDYFKSSASIEEDESVDFVSEPVYVEPTLTHTYEPESIQTNENALNDVYTDKSYDAVWDMEEDVALRQDDESLTENTDHTSAPEENIDPEKDAYFSKYRKLYEPYYEPVESTLSAAAPLPPPPERKVTAQTAAPKPAAPVYQQDRPKPQTPNYIATPAPAPRPAAPKPILRNEEKKSAALPSLQELLKELEQEKLSGDDEQMKESDIDDLIQRITHD